MANVLPGRWPKSVRPIAAPRNPLARRHNEKFLGARAGLGGN